MVMISIYILSILFLTLDFGPTKPRKIAYKPPDPKALERARENRLKELKMYDILREIMFYTMFLWILMVMSYGFRDPNAFLLQKNFVNEFIDVHPVKNFRKVSSNRVC